MALQSPLAPRKSASVAETGGSRLPDYPGGPQAGQEALPPSRAHAHHSHHSLP